MLPGEHTSRPQLPPGVSFNRDRRRPVADCPFLDNWGEADTGRDGQTEIAGQATGIAGPQ